MPRVNAVLFTITVLLFATGVASAQSKCDAAKHKAYGKKVQCLENVDANAAKKGEPADSTKEAKCVAVFTTKCAKAEAQGDCSVGLKSCNDLVAAADTCRSDALSGVTTICPEEPPTCSYVNSPTSECNSCILSMNCYDLNGDCCDIFDGFNCTCTDDAACGARLNSCGCADACCP